jgi:RNA polymerase sigma-70 factor (ECF subfamily)
MMGRDDETAGDRPLIPAVTSLQAPEPAVVAPKAATFFAPERARSEFEAVYREHFRFVWRSVRRLGVLGSSVDDVVQEVFLVVHRRMDDFEGRSSTKTWLYGIMRRVIADHRRTQRRKPAWSEGAPGQLDRVHDTRLPPDASAEQAEQVRLLYRLLDALDDDKREVFILAELEGMTMAEIAEALEVNPNTVSSRLRAARERFQAALAQETRSPAPKEEP